MRRPGWPMLVRTIKLLLAAGILFFVGRMFARDWPGIQAIEWKPGWILLSIVLNLLGLAFSAGFWLYLLGLFGPRPTPLAAYRAYYIGQLGKYIPGKAIALLMRATLVRGHGVKLSIAILTSFYEVFTTMSAGALIAAIVFGLRPPTIGDFQVPPYLAGLLLLGVCGVPLLPSVFNFLVSRAMRRFQKTESAPLPSIGMGSLFLGLVMTALGWWLIGLSTWVGLNAVASEPIPWTLGVWTTCTAGIALSWVGGFLAIIMPGGLGVREVLLLKLLAPLGPTPEIAAAVLLTRVAWTLGELVLAGVLYLAGSDQEQLTQGERGASAP